MEKIPDHLTCCRITINNGFLKVLKNPSRSKLISFSSAQCLLTLLDHGTLFFFSYIYSDFMQYTLESSDIVEWDLR